MSTRETSKKMSKSIFDVLLHLAVKMKNVAVHNVVKVYF